MAEPIGVIGAIQKVVFRNLGGEWEVEGYSLVFRKVDGTHLKIPVVIRGKSFIEIPNGAQIIGIDYDKKISIPVGGLKSGLKDL